MFKRVLIANRGEIALRVIRACRELGVETVAVFSEADRGARYLSLADEAYCIGEAKASESYLNQKRVIAAAVVGGEARIDLGRGCIFVEDFAFPPRGDPRPGEREAAFVKQGVQRGGHSRGRLRSLC